MKNLLPLRAATVLLPLLFLITVDFLRHTVLINTLHNPLGFLATYGLVAMGVIAFSWWVFGLIERLQSQLVAHNTRLDVLNRVAAASAQHLELQGLLEAALDNVLATMGMECGAICILNREQEELAAACYRGLSDALAERVKRAKLADDPVGRQVVTTGKAVVMEHIFENPNVSELAKKEGIQAVLSVPLRAHGDVTGVLAIATKMPRVFLPSEVEMLTNLGNQLGMAIHNSVLYEAAQQTNRELATLLAVSEAATANLDLDGLLSRSMDTLLHMTGVEAAETWLVEGTEVKLQVHRGAFAGNFLEKTRLRIGEGFPGIAAQTMAPVISHQVTEEPGFLRQEVKDAGFHTYCAWPLMHQGKVLGAFAVAARSPDALKRSSELRLLEGISVQLAVAIENAQLYRQVQDAAIVEERERIAREMHDGLAQVLGYMNTQVLALRRLLQSDATEKAMLLLTEMQEAVQQVYADVREGILGLRSSPGNSAGLPMALEEYLERYRSMAGFEVRLEVSEAARNLSLPHACQVQLIRVIQEALSNTRKHAQASSATVSLSRSDGRLCLVVSDDGIGFDPSMRPNTGWPRFGLQTMRERVEAIGGTFEMKSAPGEGTTVIASYPVGED